MKFGKLPSVDHLDPDFFTLPPVDGRFPWESNKGDACEVRVGGTMWTIKSWRGSVYPQKAPQRLWPELYGQQFAAIEFNATHYRIYPPEKMAAWAKDMPQDFRFCAKFPQLISHFRRFNNCEGPTDDFIDGILALGHHAGVSFIQLPPHYAPKHAMALTSYLQKWPRELPLAIEFRHADWFSETPEAMAMWEMLSALGIGAVMSDTAGRRDALHMRITAPHVLVRFGGYAGHVSDRLRLEEWARWINHHKDRGLKSFDLLVHQPDSIYTPQTCIDFAQLVKEITGISCRGPQLPLENISLSEGG